MPTDRIRIYNMVDSDQWMNFFSMQMTGIYNPYNKEPILWKRWKEIPAPLRHKEPPAMQMAKKACPILSKQPKKSLSQIKNY